MGSSTCRTVDTVYVDKKLVRPVHQFPFLPNTLVSYYCSRQWLFTVIHGRKLCSAAPEPTNLMFKWTQATVVRAYRANANTNPVYGDYVRKAS